MDEGKHIGITFSVNRLIFITVIPVYKIIYGNKLNEDELTKFLIYDRII